MYSCLNKNVYGTFYDFFLIIVSRLCVNFFVFDSLTRCWPDAPSRKKKSWNCLNGGSSRDFFTHDNSQGSCTPENELDLSLVYCYIHHHIIIREMVQQLELIKLISFSSENNFNLIFFVCWIKAMKNYFQLMHVHTKKKEITKLLNHKRLSWVSRESFLTRRLDIY